MMLPCYFLVAAIFATQSAALPGGSGNGHRGSRGSGGVRGRESSGGGRGVERSSSGSGTGAVLGGLGGYSLGSALGSSFRSLSYSRDSTSSGEGISSHGDSSTVNNYTQSPENSTGLYTIANITIHQYPLITDCLNDSTLPIINENVILWVFDIDKGKPNTATAAQCDLTWSASAASSSDPPAKHQMRCVNKGADGGNQGLPNYLSDYNVTFQQQTESPLSGFDLFITSSTRGPLVWAPRNLSSDVTWQINENYFQHPGFVPIGKASPSKKRAATSAPDTFNDQIKITDLASNATVSAAVNTRRSTSNAPIDQIEVTDLSNATTARAAANGRRPAPDNTTAQSVVAGVINSTLANAAVHVASATFNSPKNEIEISEIINSTLASSALNIGSATGNGPTLAPNTSNTQSKTTDPANNTIIDAAIDAASALFNIPKSQIKVVNVTNNPTTSAATSGSSHIQTADITLKNTVNAAVNAASTLFNIPKSQIKVIAASDNTTAIGAAAVP